AAWPSLVSLLETLRVGAKENGRGELALDDREDVLLAHDEELVLVDLELGPRVLRVQDLVADLDVDGFALAVVEDPARPDGQDLALVRLLLGGVREDDAALGHLLTRGGLDHDPVAQRAKLRRGSGGGGQRPFLLRRRPDAAVLPHGLGTSRARRPDEPD